MKMGSCTDCYDTGQDRIEIHIDPRDHTAKMSENIGKRQHSD